MALIFCSAMSSSILTCAAALMAGLFDIRFRGSAIRISGGFRSSPGKRPLLLTVASLMLLYAWGMPNHFHIVYDCGGIGAKAEGGSGGEAGACDHPVVGAALEAPIRQIKIDLRSFLNLPASMQVLAGKLPLS